MANETEKLNFKFYLNLVNMGNSLVVHWLVLCASTAGGTGSIPGWETKIPHATRRGQK